MKEIESGSVDAIITDPPYGTTACKWDSVIPFDKMWERLNKLIKPNGAIVLFGSEPFSSALRMSNIKNYKYDWVWEKEQGTGFARSKKQPLRKHEIVSIFYEKQPYYDSQGEKLDKPRKVKRKANSNNKSTSDSLANAEERISVYTHETKHTLLRFNRERGLHPTQKPVALMEYLIKTYTNKNETVLDFTMGSGSTGVACKNLNRNFIGIEISKEYLKIAEERIKNTPDKLL
jgi:site-specific DNA-methyltransferase (adenine-specific)